MFDVKVLKQSFRGAFRVVKSVTGNFHATLFIPHKYIHEK